MKKCILIAWAAVLLTVWGAGVRAEAARDLSYSVTMTEAGVTVTGQAPEAEGEEILFRVLQGSGDGLGPEALVYMEQKAPEADGGFAFSCVLPYGGETVGETFVPAQYTISLGSLKQRTQTGEVIAYYGAAYQEAILTRVNKAKAAKDAAGLTAATEELCANLTVGAAAYDELLEAGHSFADICDRVLAAPQADSMEAYVAQLNQGAAEYMLLHIDGAEAEDLVQFVEDPAHQAYLGIGDSTAMTTYRMLGKNYAGQCCRRYQELLAEGKEREPFALAVISVGMKNAGGYEDVKEILSVNQALLGIDYEAYKLTESELTSLRGMTVNALSDIKEALDTIVKNRKTDGGGSPGGSPGGGKTGGYSSPTGITGGSSGVVAGPSGSAAPEQGYQTRQPFTDLEGYDWARESIAKLYEQGIINGRSQDAFEPGGPVLREEFVKIMIEAAGIRLSGGTGARFSDVAADAWYSPYIETAVSVGLVTGREDGTFGVGEPIARQDIAVILKRMLYAETEPEPDGTLFTDQAAIADYAKDGVAVMRQTGLMVGYEDGSFLPLAEATRAEAAVLTDRVMELIQSGGAKVNA